LIVPEIAPETTTFPVADCESCGKTVLTWVALGPDGNETRCCVHCDAPLTGELRWISAGDLEETGYDIGNRPPKASGGGCGCGSGGGCSIRKPT
jgi:hypothetical protein